MGVSAADAGRSLADAAPVSVAGTVAGVRFLPPFHPWLLDRDGANLVPNKGARQVLWRASGTPGVLLVDGEPAAAWRTHTARRRLTLRLQPLAGGPALEAETVQDEAQRVGAALGAEGVVTVEMVT
jgi:hypothetical protein